MKKLVGILVVVLALALPSVASQGGGKSKGAGAGKPAAAEAEKEKKGKPEDAERERQAAQGRAFGKDQEKKIRDWFSNPSNLKGLPPGLAKREELPPGLQRHLERNGTLPTGLQKKVQPLPAKLESQLPKTPAGVKRVVVAGNVVLLEERTSKILDILNEVVGGGRRSEGSTGVKRQ